MESKNIALCEKLIFILDAFNERLRNVALVYYLPAHKFDILNGCLKQSAWRDDENATIRKSKILKNIHEDDGPRVGGLDKKTIFFVAKIQDYGTSQ